MGLFGGDSESEQSSTQATAGAQTQAGNAASTTLGTTTLDDGAQLNIRVVETDFGAVREGIGLAESALYRNQKALEAAFDFGSESLGFAENTQERAFKVFDATLDSINQSSSDAVQQVAAFAEQSAANPDGKLEKITLFGLVAAVALVLGPSLIAQIK